VFSFSVPIVFSFWVPITKREVIRPDGPPRALENTVEWNGESSSPQNGWFSSAHRWLVLSAP
jgi:hypothetical protein